MTSLTDALALSSPDQTLRLYRDWAATYDSGFATGMQYLLPAHVAAAYVATGAPGPVLDVGAGTGLLAERLREMGFQGEIDAADYSPEMLARAAEKGLYTHLSHADITRPLALPRRYAGVVSSGTFTAGQVGPQALPHLLDVALPGAQFALSVNLRVWQALGFDTALEGLSAQGRILDLNPVPVQVYGAAAAALDPDHASDRALVVLFRAA